MENTEIPQLQPLDFEIDENSIESLCVDTQLEVYKLSYPQMIRWCAKMYDHLIFNTTIVKAYWFDSEKKIAGITLVTNIHDKEVTMLEALLVGPTVSVWTTGKDGNIIEYDRRMLTDTDLEILYKPLIDPQKM